MIALKKGRKKYSRKEKTIGIEERTRTKGTKMIGGTIEIKEMIGTEGVSEIEGMTMAREIIKIIEIIAIKETIGNIGKKRAISRNKRTTTARSKIRGSAAKRSKLNTKRRITVMGIRITIAKATTTAAEDKREQKTEDLSTTIIPTTTTKKI